MASRALGVARWLTRSKPVPQLRSGWLEQVGTPQPPPTIGASAEVAGLCTFLKRCPVRIDGVCNVAPPLRVVLRDGKEVLCHHDEARLQQLHARHPVSQEVR